MARRIIYICDSCGKEIGENDGRYTLQCFSRGKGCKHHISGKSIVFCESCFEQVYKKSGLDEEGEDEE